MKTRYRVAALLFCLTVVPLAVLTGFQYQHEAIRQAELVNRSLEAQAQGAARDLALRVDRMLDNARADVAIPGMAEALARPERADVVRVNQVLTLVSQREAAYTSSVGLLDLDGRNRADTQADRIGHMEPISLYLDQAEWPRYPRAVGPLALPGDRGQRSLIVLSPVRLIDRPVGLLRIRLESGLLGQVLTESFAEQFTTQGVLLDAQGHLLAWTDPGLRDTDVFASAELARLSEPASFTWRGQLYLGAVATVAGTGWQLLAYQASPGEGAAARGWLREWGGLLVWTTLVSLLAAWLIATRLSKPIARFSDAALAIAEGHLERRLTEEQGPEEFQQLSRAFNRMSDRLSANLASLSSELAQRTQAEQALRDSQAQLQALNMHLEQQVQQRTADLAQAKEAAEAANRAKSSFLANMSHEIRTPMNAVVGLAELMRTDVRQPQERDRLDKLAGAAKHLMTLLDDVLDYSRMEAGKLKLQPVAFAPASVVQRVLGMVELSAADKGLTLEVQLSPGLAAAYWGDERRIRQILLNLVGNAIKFTSRGQVLLAVEPLASGGGRSGLRMTVQDTGMGLSEAQQRRVFQAFEQIDGSSTRQYGGAGLGLSICQELCALMGGQIGVDSQPGVGSVFWVELPLALVQEDAVPVARGDRHPEARALVTAPLPARSGQRVLVVDDNPVNLEITQALLARHGIQVSCAEDGREALDLARRQQRAFDLILMDMHMPRMDGLAATRHLRDMPAYRHTPILAMTANVYEEDRQRCLDAGMSAHLGKPVTAVQLALALDHWLPAEADS